MDVGLFVLRVIVGLLFVGHGTQKLFGWFGGPGLDGTAGFMASLRYRQPRLAALAASVFEIGAGSFLAAGFLTPLAAAAVIGVMINATVTVKWPAGLFAGYEIDLLYATIAAALAFTGAGAYSLDAALGLSLAGTTWGLFSIGLAAVIAGLVLASRAPAVIAPAGATERPRAA